MFEVSFSNQFKKDYKLCKKRNFDMVLLDQVLEILRKTGQLPSKYKPHTLSGDYKGSWECHIKPDWLLIWVLNSDEKEIALARTGTHSDLF